MYSKSKMNAPTTKENDAPAAAPEEKPKAAYEPDKSIPEQEDSEDVNTTLKRLREKTVGIIHMEIRPTNVGEYIIVKRRIIEEAWILDNATYPDKDVPVRKLGIINEGVITPA
jgi:hypothetical protein